MYFSWGEEGLSFLAQQINVKAQVIQREKWNFTKINSNFLTKLPDLFAEGYIFAGYIKLLCILLEVLCLYNSAKYTHFALAISSSLFPSCSRPHFLSASLCRFPTCDSWFKNFQTYFINGETLSKMLETRRYESRPWESGAYFRGF